VDAPKVTAIVVNWNGRELLEAALRSLQESDYGRLAILVVDNASEDGSQDLVHESFPDVGLVENETNEGYAAGANAGIRVAMADGADYVFLMNNDLVVAPDAVSALVAAASERPDAAFVGPMIYYHEPPNLIWSLGGAVSYWSGNIRHHAIREKDDGRYIEAREVDYVTGAAVLASAAALARIGLMDEEYYMYNEDTDWCARAALLGYGVIVEPRAKAWHRVSMSSGGGLTPYKIYHRLRSTYRFFGLYAKPYHWLGIVPATIVRSVVFTLGQLLSGKPSNAAAVARGTFDIAAARKRKET
jgi:GT2 family glycosyltransferase